MKVLYPGHRYALDIIDGPGWIELQYLQRPPLHEPKPGVLYQEVLRTVIDRVQVLDKEVPWWGNEEIIRCGQRMILLGEVRAMERDLEKGSLKPELVKLDARGHFHLVQKSSGHP